MAPSEKELTVSIRPVDWSADAEAGLALSLGDDLPIIRAEIARGESVLWRCTAGEFDGYAVTRVEVQAGEAVMVACEGSGFDVFAPFIVRHFRNQGFRLRAHVKRRGMIRMWQRYGLHLNEFVLRG